MIVECLICVASKNEAGKDAEGLTQPLLLTYTMGHISGSKGALIEATLCEEHGMAATVLRGGLLALVDPLHTKARAGQVRGVAGKEKAKT